MRIFYCLFIALLNTLPANAQESSRAPRPEAKGSTIGYPTTAAALAALKQKAGVEIHQENGWIIAQDKSGGSPVLWSFTTDRHPAHPSAVKRSIVEQDGGFFIEMNVLCQAEKAPCDKLVSDFELLNAQISASMQKGPKESDANPRAKEAEAFAVQWLELIESDRFDESFALLTDAFKANLTAESWKKAVLDENEKVGRLKVRKLKRIVWYQDPKDAPLPGTYAAVEFDSSYANAEKHFRYVILHSLNGEPFKVMRNESTFQLNPKSN